MGGSTGESGEGGRHTSVGRLNHAKPSGDGNGKPQKGNTEGAKFACELVHPKNCVRLAQQR